MKTSMKSLKSHLLRLVFLLLLTNFTLPAWAIYNDCTSAQLPMNTSLPAVGVLSNLPLGQAIPGAVINVTTTITCKNYTFTAGSVWRLTGPTAIATAFPNVYTVAGMPSGIGFRFKDQSGTPLTASGASIIVNNEAPNAGTTLNFSFELVKLSNSIAQASSAPIWNLNVYNQQFANGTETQSNIKFAITIQRPNIPTCKPSNSDTQVNLPPVLVSDFKGINSTVGSKGFNISLQCEANAAPSVTLSDSTQPANMTSLIALTPQSSAAGVAVQILSNNSPVILSPSGQPGGGSTVINPPSSSIAQTINIPLMAQYIQSGQQVRQGSVTGIATFTLSYQ